MNIDTLKEEMSDFAKQWDEELRKKRIENARKELEKYERVLAERKKALIQLNGRKDEYGIGIDIHIMERDMVKIKQELKRLGDD